MDSLRNSRAWRIPVSVREATRGTLWTGLLCLMGAALLSACDDGSATDANSGTDGLANAGSYTPTPTLQSLQETPTLRKPTETPERTTMPTKALDAGAYGRCRRKRSTLEPTATPTTASTLEPTTTTTPTATPTPTPEEAAAARLSTIIPWFDSPPDSAHSSARESLVSLWLRDANLGDAVGRMPWIADGVTRVESFVLGTIDGIAMIDPELGNLLATYEWFTAGLNDDEWASVIEPLFQIVVERL